MKNKVLITTFVMGGWAMAASAQVTINHSIFPTANTVLTISTAADIDTMTVSAPAATAQTWDFSHLQTAFFREETIQDATLGAAYPQFPTTEVTQTLLPGLGGTAYVDVDTTGGRVNIVGGGLDFFGFAFIEPYDDPHKLQIAPLTYNTSYNDDFQVNFGAHIDSVPFLRQIIDSLSAGVLPPGIEPDSIRFNIEGERTATIDAFGTLTAHDGTYEVLRQKVLEYTNFQVEVRIDPPFFSPFWVDITPYISSAAPMDIPTKDTTLYYDYLANGNQQPIVRFNMRNDGAAIDNIEFKGINNDTSIAVQLTPAPLPLLVYPNPAHTTLNVDMGDLSNATCRLQLVGIDGKIWLEMTADHADLVQYPVQTIPSGLYTLLVRDTQGSLLRRQKVLIGH